MSAATFYTHMAATATRLLTKFGKHVTLVRSTGSSYDPVTGAAVPVMTANVSGVGLLKPFPDVMVDSTRVLASDRLLVLDATAEPMADDRPQINGEDWTIVDIKTVKPDDATAVVYFVHVRK